MGQTDTWTDTWPLHRPPAMHTMRAASIILIPTITFLVLLCWLKARSHCEMSPSSFEKCRLSSRWQPTLTPSQTTRAVSLPVAATIHIHHRHLLVLPSTQPKSWYSFHCAIKGGKLSQPKYCSKGVQLVPKLYKSAYHSGSHDKHNSVVRFKPGFSHCSQVLYH